MSKELKNHEVENWEYYEVHLVYDIKKWEKKEVKYTN